MLLWLRSPSYRSNRRRPDCQIQAVDRRRLEAVKAAETRMPMRHMSWDVSVFPGRSRLLRRLVREPGAFAVRAANDEHERNCAARRRSAATRHGSTNTALRCPSSTRMNSMNTSFAVVLAFQCECTVPGLMRRESPDFSVTGSLPSPCTTIVPSRM